MEGQLDASFTQPLASTASSLVNAPQAFPAALFSDVWNVCVFAPAVFQAVVAAADAVVGAIDAAELAIFLAQKCAEEGPGAAQRKKGERASQNSRQRLQCCCCSGNALASDSQSAAIC
jgi:hypothetical protein